MKLIGHYQQLFHPSPLANFIANYDFCQKMRAPETPNMAKNVYKYFSQPTPMSKPEPGVPSKGLMDKRVDGHKTTRTKDYSDERLSGHKTKII